MDYKKNLKICTCLKKKWQKQQKNQTNGVSYRSEYFCECVWMSASAADVWWLVCVSNIPVCTMFFFFSFSFVAYQDVWNIRGHFCLFCSNGNFVFSCLERESLCVYVCVCVCVWVCVCFPSPNRDVTVCFESEWTWERERERERGQLHNTSFLSPALHPHIEIEMHTFVNVSFALITWWPPLVYFP